MKSNSELA